MNDDSTIILVDGDWTDHVTPVIDVDGWIYAENDAAARGLRLLDPVTDGQAAHPGDELDRALQAFSVVGAFRFGREVRAAVIK